VEVVQRGHPEVPIWTRIHEKEDEFQKEKKEGKDPKPWEIWENNELAYKQEDLQRMQKIEKLKKMNRDGTDMKPGRAIPTTDLVIIPGKLKTEVAEEIRYSMGEAAEREVDEWKVIKTDTKMAKDLGGVRVIIDPDHKLYGPGAYYDELLSLDATFDKIGFRDSDLHSQLVQYSLLTGTGPKTGWVHLYDTSVDLPMVASTAEDVNLEQGGYRDVGGGGSKGAQRRRSVSPVEWMPEGTVQGMITASTANLEQSYAKSRRKGFKAYATKVAMKMKRLTEVHGSKKARVVMKKDMDNLQAEFVKLGGVGSNDDMMSRMEAMMNQGVAFAADPMQILSEVNDVPPLKPAAAPESEAEAQGGEEEKEEDPKPKEVQDSKDDESGAMRGAPLALLVLLTAMLK